MKFCVCRSPPPCADSCRMRPDHLPVQRVCSPTFGSPSRILDEVWTVTGREPLRELVALFRRAVDAVVFLKPFKRLMWAAFLARVPIRVATGYRWYSVLADRRVYEHRKGFSKHETAYNVGMLAGLGLQPGIVSRPSLVLTDEETSVGTRAVARHADTQGGGSIQAGLRPGTGALSTIIRSCVSCIGRAWGWRC